MRKLMIVLLGLLAVLCLSGCSNTTEQDEPQNADATLVASSLDAAEPSDREISEFDPDDYDVILRDDDDWYVLLNYVSSRRCRTYLYQGSVYMIYHGEEYWQNAWMLYDNDTQSMSISLIGPYDETDLLYYTMVYSEELEDGYEFNGSYGWRDEGFGNSIMIDFVQGRLGSLTADDDLDNIEVKEARIKTTADTID